MADKERFLLHVCCAPCSPHPLRTLKERYDVTLYYYNPNIHPAAEYRARLEEVERLAGLERVPLLIGEYRPEEWLAKAAPWKDEPEKGKRCVFCIDDRLSEAARMAAQRGFPRFGSVLTVSSRKNVVMVNRIGAATAARHGELEFDPADWKKKEGTKISVRIANQLGFRRQQYCGCVYSVQKAVLCKGSAA